MDSTQNKTTFDELVSGISAEERNFLLAKINKSKEQDILILQSSREIEDAGYLDAKYKTEPFLYKFFCGFVLSLQKEMLMICTIWILSQTLRGK